MVVITTDEKLFSQRNDEQKMEEIESDRWFDPAFQNFINNQVVAFYNKKGM